MHNQYIIFILVNFFLLIQLTEQIFQRYNFLKMQLIKYLKYTKAFNTISRFFIHQVTLASQLKV